MVLIVLVPRVIVGTGRVGTVPYDIILVVVFVVGPSGLTYPCFLGWNWVKF